MRVGASNKRPWNVVDFYDASNEPYKHKAVEINGSHILQERPM